MAQDILDLIETMPAGSAREADLFGDAGRRVRSPQQTAQYQRRLLEAGRLVNDVMSGRRDPFALREAMTTSDFPYLFGDILDRQVLAAYREWPSVWRMYANQATVPDFRAVKRYGVYGAESVLETVAENAGYPMAKLSEDTPFSYSVKKYGRKLPFSWETLINDDLDALKRIPERFGRAARRTEDKFATGLHVDASGPHASVYTVGYANKVTGNPVLGITGLQTAMVVLSAMVDQEGEPIFMETITLEVPPALEITALNILNATELTLDPNNSAGTANQVLRANNWMKNRLNLCVNPYIPIVASSANGNTSWFLHADPRNGRPAFEIGHLRGHAEPEIFVKAPNAQRVGGGSDAMAGDFDTDAIEYKIRHVMGGAAMDPKMTVASNGSGS